MNLKGCFFTKDWTLFLDRDGVISRRLPGDYVKRWEEFSFLEGVPDAIAVFGELFGLIIVVSNQQGVGKGLMSREDLEMIDARMKKELRNTGGRIDATYYCTRLASENHPDRKPGSGMGLKARADFPGIDFSKSVMVGDSPSDIEFGKSLGMITVFISEDNEKHADADYNYRSLRNFADAIK